MITNSRQMEDRIAKRLKEIFGIGRAQPGSGNQPQSPNDVAIPSVGHIECKLTEAKSMVVPHEWIKRAEMLALTHAVPACIALHFGPDKRDFFLIPDEDFYEYMELKRGTRS